MGFLSVTIQYQILVTVVIYSIVIFIGSPFVMVFCKGLDLPEEGRRGLKGAGKYIGYFERFIVLSFVLLNQFAAIALILTAKSIARFEELKRREIAEYYLIGTLSSLSWAIFWGMILRFFLK